LNTSNRIAIIGAGFMGSVIAALYARHGFGVALHDSSQEMLKSFRDRVRPIVETLSDSVHMTSEILERVKPIENLEAAVSEVFLVHEVVQEVLPIKRELFAKLDRMCDTSTVLATNTSSLLLSDIAHDVKHKERVLGIHYFTPAHIIQAVELIYADFTPPELVQWGRKFLERIDHVGVACLERPGFLINRIQFAMLSEVYRIMDEKIATRDDVDAAVRLCLGPRLALWGPLLTEDLVVSKKTVLAVTEYLHEQTKDPNFAVRPVLRQLVEAGSLGAVSGKGWYDFSSDYSAVVSNRDSQLRELLFWLRSRNPLGRIGPDSQELGEPNGRN
jgi:3-hydroxybutyryl-CoA dehydrogenase